MSFHIAPYTKRLPTTCMLAFKRFLTGVRMTVYSEARRPRESFVTGLADISVL